MGGLKFLTHVLAKWGLISDLKIMYSNTGPLRWETWILVIEIQILDINYEPIVHWKMIDRA